MLGYFVEQNVGGHKRSKKTARWVRLHEEPYSSENEARAAYRRWMLPAPDRYRVLECRQEWVPTAEE